MKSKLVFRLSLLAIVVFGGLSLYHNREALRRFYYNRQGYGYPPYIPTHVKVQATCPPEQWVDGHWVVKPNFTFPQVKELDDIYPIAGFKRCASTQRLNWHLGGYSERPDRFPKIDSYQWKPGCEIPPFRAEEMVRDLVNLGGWLILGDSVSEGHFFSISCSLGEHVRADPAEDVGEMTPLPQQLFLSKDSPLVSSLHFPDGFDINTTPLITFIRCDFLVRIDTLNGLYRSLHNPPPGFKLFKDEFHKTSGPEDYMPIFTNPRYHYSTMIVSTAAWWNTETLTGLKDQDKPIEHGNPELIQFFYDAMRLWAHQVQEALFKDQQLLETQFRKQVIVRAFPGGHDSCFERFEPTQVDMGHPVGHYNWPWISNMNIKFEEVVKTYLDIHYLGIDHPARLRPDAHAAWDCLHYAVGTGVNEGWTHYIWYYITDLASRKLLAAKGSSVPYAYDLPIPEPCKQCLEGF